MPSKKSKKQVQELDLDNCEKLIRIKPSPRRNSNEPPINEFDDLVQFETFLKDESWDNDFDFIHAKLKYIPPFILHEVHDDLDKIKPTMNKKSKKFVRNLHHHIDKHLISDINKASGLDMKFRRISTEETFTNMSWKYLDDTDHGLAADQLNDRHWKVELNVSCNNEDPMVLVDYKSIPLTSESFS